MAYINNTDVIGLMITSMTINVTGSLFVTLLIIVGAFTLLDLALGLPLELSIIAVFPLLIASAIYTAEFLPVLAVGILYLSILLTKWLMQF